jgi:hypothetical protein
MPDRHRALVVHYAPGHPSESLTELERLLDDGWRIASTAAMGGTGGATAPPQFAALILLRRDDEKTVSGFR